MGNAIKARNEKSQLKCFVCLKILKTPVYLPCSCRLTICYEHVLKESRIRCKKCKVTFATNVKHLFKEDDKKLKKLAAYSYLNRIEKKHFQTMSTLLKQTKHISETLSIKILEFPLVQYEHFSQLRNKIDIDRETSIQAVYANVTHLKRRTKILEKLHKLSEKLLKQIDTNEILFRNEYTLKKSSWSAFSNAYFDYDREIERLSEIFREPKKFTQTFLHKLTRDYLLEHDSMQRKLDEFERIENDLKLYGSFDSSILFESLLQRLDCIAVSSDDRCQIDIWDMDKCVKIDSLYGHTRPVVCLSLYGDNDIKLVSGSDDGLIKIWNLDEKFECVKTLRGHLSGIICLKIIRHKLHCVSASHDKTIKIWCLREFICLFTLGDPQRRLSCLELLKSPYNDDDVLLASGFCEGTIRLWDLSKRESTNIMYGHLKAVKCLTSCVPYNNNNNNKTDHFKRSNLFASCSWDRTIKIWSLNCLGHTCLRTLYGHQDYLSDLVYVQESNCLISGAWDKSIRIWSLNTYECVRVVKMNSPIKCLTFDATRAQLMCGLLDKSVRVLDLERNEFEKYLKIFSTVNCFVLLEN